MLHLWGGIREVLCTTVPLQNWRILFGEAGHQGGRKLAPAFRNFSCFHLRNGCVAALLCQKAHQKIHSKMDTSTSHEMLYTKQTISGENSPYEAEPSYQSQSEQLQANSNKDMAMLNLYAWNWNVSDSFALKVHTFILFIKCALIKKASMRINRSISLVSNWRYPSSRYALLIWTQSYKDSLASSMMEASESLTTRRRFLLNHSLKSSATNMIVIAFIRSLILFRSCLCKE